MRQWESSSWSDSVQDWISRVLSNYGVTQTGPYRRVTLDLAATVLEVPTEAGVLYFKATAPARSHEAEIVAKIAGHSRGHVPSPLAIAPDEGWFLSPGMGSTVTTPAADLPAKHWNRVFSDAAQLQLSLAGAAEDLAEGGVPGLLPNQTAEYLDEALTMQASLPAEHPLHISGADADLLSNGLAVVEEAATILAAVEIPMTLQQGTLNPSQVLVPASTRAPLMFIGWGAARWSHPFGLIGPAVQELCSMHACEPNQEPVRSMVAAYLEPFTHLAPAAELEEMLAPAALLAYAQRYQASMDLLMGADREEQAAAAPEVMRLLGTALATPERSSRRSAKANRPGGAARGARRRAV